MSFFVVYGLAVSFGLTSLAQSQDSHNNRHYQQMISNGVSGKVCLASTYSLYMPVWHLCCVLWVAGDNQQTHTALTAVFMKRPVSAYPIPRTVMAIVVIADYAVHICLVSSRARNSANLEAAVQDSTTGPDDLSSIACS